MCWQIHIQHNISVVFNHFFINIERPLFYIGYKKVEMKENSEAIFFTSGLLNRPFIYTITATLVSLWYRHSKLYIYEYNTYQIMTFDRKFNDVLASCVRDREPGMVGLPPKWVRLAPKGTNPGLFQIRFQCIWRSRAKCTEI